MLGIQNWLREGGQYANLKKGLHGLIAGHQEAGSRFLMESESDPRKLAEAQAEAEKANKLLLVIHTLDTIRDGGMELPITKISVKH